MKANEKTFDRLILKRDRAVFIIAMIVIVLTSLFMFFDRYYKRMDKATTEYSNLRRVYYIKLDPNELLRSTGVSIIVLLIICIALIFYNKMFIDNELGCKYLLKRIPRKNYYLKSIIRYPLIFAALGTILLVLLEVYYIYFTYNNDPRLIDLRIAVDYLKLIF